MKKICPNCGATIEINGRVGVCEFCGTQVEQELIENESLKDFEIDGETLISYNGSGKKVNIPDCVKTIGDEAFIDNAEVTSIVVPDTVVEIKDRAFANCWKLEKIVLSNNLIKIGNEAFKHSYLKEVTIPESVEYIGERAFFESRELVKLNLPKHLISNMKQSFRGCMKLKDVQIDFNFFSQNVRKKKDPTSNDERPGLFETFEGSEFLVNTRKLFEGELGVCPYCSGQIKKTLFSKKCQNCGREF